MQPTHTRRQILERAGIALASSATALGYPANETINVGCIGTGGRCRVLMRSLGDISNVRITALADVWDESLAEAKKLADPKAFVTKDYHELLKRSDVDAVVIGSPDHWHVPMTIDACAAGKDVYVEKPLTHKLSEGAEIIAAHNQYKRIVQVGMQQRSMPHLQQAYEIVKSGQLGKIHKVHMTWNRNMPRGDLGRGIEVDPNTVDWKRFLGNAPDQPFDKYRFRHWRWFWDFGGGTVTDLMVHWMDVVNWYLDLDLPASATSMGDIFRVKDWETPDTMQTLLHYPDQQVQAYFEGTFVNARNAAMIEFMGAEGTLYVDRGRYEVIPDLKRTSGSQMQENALKPAALIVGEGTRGQDFYRNIPDATLHLANWLECVRTRKQPRAPVEEGVKAAAAAHLANIAYRTGQVAYWKDVKNRDS